MNKISLNGLNAETVTIILQRASEGDGINLKYQCKNCTVSIFADQLIVGEGRIDIALRSANDEEWIPTEHEKHPIITRLPIEYFNNFIQQIKESNRKELLKVWEAWETGDWITSF